MNYGDLWSGLLFPAYERLRGRRTPAIEAELRHSQFAPPAELERRQGLALQALLEHARAHVPFYGQWFAQGGPDPARIAQTRDLAALPLVDKAMLMDRPELFRAAPLPPGSYAKQTGGSTGRPLKFYLDPLSDQWRQAVSRRGYAWAGCRDGDRQVYLWGADLVPVSLKYRARREMFRRLARQRFFPSFGLGPAELDQVLRAIERFGPRCLVGYTSALEILARRAQETGWRPKRGPRSVIAAAEALRPDQRQLIEAAMGCPVFETYGSREFMLVAAQCPEHAGLHVSAENLLVEVLVGGQPAQPGQLGEVVITDLHNYAQPFIRYRTGDLAEPAPAEPCACGRSLPRLARVEGRILDVIKGPDGRVLPGEFFPHLLKDFAAVEQFQVRQDAIDHIVINLVLRGPLERQCRELVLQSLARALPGLRVDIVEVDQIAPTPAGKRRVTIGLPPEEGR